MAYKFRCRSFLSKAKDFNDQTVNFILLLGRAYCNLFLNRLNTLKTYIRRDARKTCAFTWLHTKNMRPA